MSESSAAIPFIFAGFPGFLDSIEGAPLPILRAIGWYAGRDLPPMALKLANRKLLPESVARRYRPDVVAARAADWPFSGFRADFLFEPGEVPEVVSIGSQEFAVSNPDAFGRVSPHYRGLFNESRVLGRDSIYGSGPPADVSGEFKDFIAGAATGRVLDFGCGNGDLVEFLKDRGLAVQGMELDEPRLRNAARPGAAEHLQYYPGGTPLPFADASFDTIASTEVIEHVHGIAGYVDELARVLRRGGILVLTTPDISSIPSSFPAGCVPWHLLESTHVNFFTPASVKSLFAPRFHLERLFCLGGTRVNGLFVPGSIGAVLRVR